PTPVEAPEVPATLPVEPVAGPTPVGVEAERAPVAEPVEPSETPLVAPEVSTTLEDKDEDDIRKLLKGEPFKSYLNSFMPFEVVSVNGQRQLNLYVAPDQGEQFAIALKAMEDGSATKRLLDLILGNTAKLIFANETEPEQFLRVFGVAGESQPLLSRFKMLMRRLREVRPL
ncbi:MAG: hypothetical protein ACD_65C00243G0001, partial [uncultured bacterium]